MVKDKHPTEKVGRNPKIEQKSQPKKVEVKDASETTTPIKKISKDLFTTENLTKYPKLAWAKFMGLNRNTKLACALALILVLVGVSAFALSSDDSGSGEFASEEQVEEIENGAPKMGSAITIREGTVETKDEEGNWTAAPEDMQPEEGDALRTVGATSRAVVTFDDGSALRLDANSEVEFVTSTTERVVIRHLDGYTYNRVIPSNERDYIVESSDAQYQALGTAFKTASSGDEQSVEVYQSTVHETSSNEKPKEGEKLIVKSFANPSSDGKIEKLDIEKVKQDPFMVWNKELDEQDENYKNSLGFLQDFEAPEVNISSHQEGQTVLLDPSATEGTVEFTGNTEKGAKLTVQSKSQQGSSAIEVGIGGGGEFTTPVLTAPLGSSVFEFIVKDRTGNTTTKNIRINFQRKSAPVGGSGNIQLSAQYDEADDKIKATWAITGSLEAKEGYKLVYSESQNPKFGGNNTKSVFSDSTSAFAKDDIIDGKTYYFRVCIYEPESSDKCTNYSNQVTVTVPEN